MNDPAAPSTYGDPDLEVLVRAAMETLDAAPPLPPEAKVAARTEAPPLGAYHAAAAVMATFDRSSLRPVPSSVPGFENGGGDSLEAVIRDSKLVATGSRVERWALRTDVRREVLARLGGPQGINAALAANPDRDPNDPAQGMFEAYVRGNAPRIEEQDVRSLTGTLQVVEWLEGLGLLQGLPEREAVRRHADLKTLLQPFSELAGSHFAGRQNELALLRKYVGVLPPGSLLERVRRIAESVFDLHEKPPLVVWGVGGVGKSTLVSRFIWEHATLANTERFPWAYIDFDRPGMLAEEPLTLLIEAVRQLGIQYAEAREFCDRVRQQWLKMLSNRPPEIRRAMTKSIKRDDSIRATQVVSREGWDRCLVEFADLLNNLKVETSPFLLVLDTFEQVQYRSAVVVTELMEFLARFQRHVPRLRTVIVGRAPVDSSDFPTQSLELGNFDAEAARGFLAHKGVTSPDLAKRIYSLVGGSPLSLRLAAETYRQTGAVPSDLGRRYVLFRVQDNQIQAQLFARILNHIHDPDVRKLAYPGLILRRVTPDIIREVLAKPCGVELDSPGAEHRLFDEMAREVSLVRVQDDALVCRQDVRSIVLQPIHETQPARVRQIAEAAIAFYESRDGTYGVDDTARLVDRAEELYHRLFLKQPAEVLASRWLTGLEPYLASALDELPIRERAWLATRMGRSLSAEERSQVDLEGWERDTVRRTRDLLRSGKLDMALAAVRERPQRLPGSTLYALEAEALERLGDFAAVRAGVDAGIASADESGQRDLANALRIRGARADIHDARLEDANQMLKEAEVLAGDISPLRALEVRLHALALRRAEQGAAPTDARAEEIRRSLLETFDALPDGDVVDQGPLMAWLAAELAEHSQGALSRVVRLTGVSAAGPRSLREFALALTAWDASQEPPGALADGVSAPAADSLTERWTQFVLATPAAELGAAVAQLLGNSAVPSGVLDGLVKLMLERARGLLVPGDTLDHSSPEPSPEKDIPKGEVKSVMSGARDRGLPELRLSAGQMDNLSRVLIDALPTRQQLAQMTMYKLGRNLESIALSDDLRSAVLALVRLAESEGWLASLIVAARESSPGDPHLHRFAEQFGLAAAPSVVDLERFMREPSRLLDVDAWRTRLGHIETQVCSVEMAGRQSGTGFLVGPDLVLTAYRCVQHVVEGGNPRSLGFRFDRKQLDGGASIEPGTVYGLAEKDWLKNHAAPELAPASDGLDYALLRLSRSAGAEPVGGDRAEPNAPARRWLTASAPDAWAARGPLAILYYPIDQAMKLSLGEAIAVPPNGIRLHFLGNTGPGAFGAPCFDGDWNLVGMAIGLGDPSAIPTTSVVAITAIASHLQGAGLAGALGQALA